MGAGMQFWCLAGICLQGSQEKVHSTGEINHPIRRELPGEKVCQRKAVKQVQTGRC